MSTTIDSKVVEMRFDNKHFENNVQTTMSTLDKLKQKLNLTGASKGLETINAAAKSNNLSVLGNAAETVGLKFNGMYTIADQALRNITTRVQHTAERMVKALTLDPITTGFQEYETQINAVQTILANTSHNGTTIDQVNKALETLNTYADKTIYNFTEMTRNIGTFTAAGVDLQTSVDSIQGIANLAAVSGSTSQQASTAMYQLSQALAAGKVSLMDWNSVVNAGMGGKVFQDALVRTSELLGTGAQGAIDMYGSFRESLTKGEWLTTEVLTETLKQFAGAYSEADLIAQGFTKEQAKDIAAMAKTAEDAATKVKTFTQLWDVLKESAQSGWSQTWKLLIGDFEEAKSLLTPIAEFLTGAINKMSDFRNNILEAALNSPFGKLAEKIKSVTSATEKVNEVTKDYSNIVKRVIGGEFGNGQSRWDKLAEAGYDWAKVQNLVNEQLGSSVRHTEQLTDAQGKQAETQATTTEELLKMSDAQLKALGFTKEEIDSLREFQRQAGKTGIPIKELIKDVDQLSGRTLLINSFKNVGQSLVGVFNAMRDAWREVFHGDDTDSEIIEKRAEQLWNIIAAVHKFTTKLELNEGTAGKLARTFKGLFALLDIFTTVTGGGLKIALKVLSEILGYFDMDILDLTASMGDAIVGFRDWIDSTLDISKALDLIIPALKSGKQAIEGWIDALKGLPGVQKLIESITRLSEGLSSIKMGNLDVFDKIVSAFKKLTGLDLTSFINKFLSSINKLTGSNFKSIGEFITEGLIGGLGKGIAKVIDYIANLAATLINKFCDLLGINSPSKVFMTLGGFIIAGLILGLKEGFISVPESLQGIVDKCTEVLKNVDWGAVFAFGASVAGLMFIKKIGDALETIAAPFEGIGDILEETADVVKSFGKAMKSIGKAVAFDIKTKAIKNLAISLAILVGAVIAIVYVAGDDYTKILKAVGIIILLAGVLAGLAWAVGKISSASAEIDKNGVKLGGLKSGLLTIGVAILLLAATVKLVGSLHPEQAIQGFIGLVGIMGAILGFMYACQKITDGNISENVNKIGSLMLKISFAMLLMIGVCKLASKLTPEEMLKGAAFAAGFAIFVIAITKVGKTSGNNISKVGGMILKLAIAMMLMVGICKLVDMLTPGEMIKGAAFAGAMLLFVKALVKITTIGKKQQITKLSGLLLSISLSMMLMVGVCKLVGMLSVEEMLKGAAFAAGFAIFVWGLIKITKIGNDQQIAKVGGTILALSVAIGVMALVCMMLSLLSIEGLIKGVTAVSILGLVMAQMVKSLQGAQDIKSSLIVMVVAIALMAGAVAALTLIDGKKLAGTTAALTILMLAFSTMVGVTKFAKNTKSMRKTLIEMLGAVLLLAGVVAALSWVSNLTKDGSMLEGAISLGILMMAFSASIAIIGRTGKISSTVAPLVKNMMIVVAELAGLLAALSSVAHFTTDGSMLEAATSLSILMAAFSTSMVILGQTGRISTTVAPLLQPMMLVVTELAGLLAALSIVAHFTADGSMLEAATSLSMLILALSASMVILGFVNPTVSTAIPAAQGMGVVLGEIALVLGLMQMFNVTPSLETAGALSILLLSLSAACVILSLVGPVAAAAVMGAVGLAGVVAVLGTLIVGIGYLMSKIPSEKLEEWKTGLANFMDFIVILAGGLGEALGAFVGGALVGLTSGLPEVGTNLSQFMENAKPFIDGVKTLDESVIIGVGALSGAILALTAADLLNGMASLLSGGISFAQLGTDLSQFMINALPFITAARTIDPAVMEGVKSLAQTILILTEADVLEGLTGWITGGSSLSSVGSELAGLGLNLNAFATNLGTFDESKVMTVTCAANAIKAIAQAAESIPTEGGWAAKILGDNSIGAFGGKLPGLGINLNAFATNLGTFDESKVSTVTCAANAIKAIAEAADALPNEGGWAAAILGDNSISAFGGKLPGLGTNLNAFATNLGTFDESKVATVKCAADAIKVMADAASSIDGQAEWAKKLFGDNSLSSFGGEIATVGTKLKEFATNLGTFDESKVATVNCAVKAIKAFSGLANADLSGAKKHLDRFGDKLGTFASDMSTFCSNMPDSSSITTAVTNVKKIVSLAKTIAEAPVEVIGDLAKNLKNAGKDGVKAFVEAFTSAFAKTDVKVAAKDLADKIIEGVESKESAIKRAFKSAAGEGVSGVKDKYQSFYSAGSYLVDGFAAGISDNTFKAETKAKAMANAAEKAAKEALDINSPSKVFRAIGYSVPEGFAMGIDRMSSLVKTSSTDMATSAIDNVKSSISRISDAINTNIDAQPTIRPVLDLSDVESGAGAINGLFGSGTSMSILGKVDSISSMMNANNQNGVAGDIVSAIDKLRKDLGNIGGTSYYIDGVTYDDGSNVSDAVKSLMRAARIERRV